MPRPVIGIIAGSGLRGASLFEGGQPQPQGTPYGAPSDDPILARRGDAEVLLLARHGPERRIPPHRLNHRANLWVLKDLGATAILATASSGSLKKSIRPGAFVIPHDFVSFWSIPTFHDEDVHHATPGLDPRLRDALASAGKAVGASVRTHGVYVQTTGPRLETPAEIEHFATLGDVLGMTMASEATLANELGIPYAAVCSVDNYCNGIVDVPLTFEAIRATQERNRDSLERIVLAAVEGMA